MYGNGIRTMTKFKYEAEIELKDQRRNKRKTLKIPTRKLEESWEKLLEENEEVWQQLWLDQLNNTQKK